MKIIVIGAAPCGLGVAFRVNELIESGQIAKDDVTLKIFERDAHAGGLATTVTDSEGFLWDMGGHITFNHNFPYYERAVKWAVDEWNDLHRNCQVDVNYMFGETGIHLVPYPAQYAVPLFPNKIKNDCLVDLKSRYVIDESIVPANFDEWIQIHFGPTISDQFFKPYTRKVWTVETSEMNSGWVGTRVAKLDEKKLDELCSMDVDELKDADYGWGPNATFTYPKYGGTGAVWNGMANKLPTEWFSFNSQVTKIDPHKKTITYVNTNDEANELVESYDVLISSAPIDWLLKTTALYPEINLVYNKVFVVGVGLDLPKPAWVEPFTWLYFPDPAVPFYRITFFSRYGEVTPDGSKYWSVMCESARKIDDPISEEEMCQLNIDGLAIKGIIDKVQKICSSFEREIQKLDVTAMLKLFIELLQTKIVSIYSKTLNYGYPIPTINRDAELARAHAILEKNSIYSRGRFGGWKYEVSNQDHCFVQGKEVVDRLCLDVPEKLYKTGVVAAE